MAWDKRGRGVEEGGLVVGVEWEDLEGQQERTGVYVLSLCSVVVVFEIKVLCCRMDGEV